MPRRSQTSDTAAQRAQESQPESAEELDGSAPVFRIKGEIGKTK
jgi:hypothetical protein